MFDSKVVTSVCHGTSIDMDACDALAFMRGIALSLISYCESVRIRESSGILISEANNGKTDFYIEKYCHGVHGAVLNNIYRQFADVLYAFVLDCVKNESVCGLYLFRERSIHGLPGYKLITYALEVYDELIDKMHEISGERRLAYNNKKYDEFNEPFEKMFE